MSSTLILATAVIAVAAIGSAVWYLLWRGGVKRRHGLEYERLRAGFGRREAVRELRERERRHAELDLHPVPDERRITYLNTWRRAELSFVDGPATAALRGEEVVNRVVADIGYPMEDEDETFAQLSVDHPNTAGGFREARGLTHPGRHGIASTEELRRAMVLQRALVKELLDRNAEQGRAHV